MQTIKTKLYTLLGIALGVVGIDQWTKYIVRTDVNWQYFDIIEGWLAFHYIQNPGMAMGIDLLPTQVIGYLTLVAIIGIVWYLLKLVKTANWGQTICFGLIIGGAIGNMIDRMFMGIIQDKSGFMDGHVVDFIHLTLEINNWAVFPYIFNFADVAISCAVIAMFVFYKKLMPEDLKSTKTSAADAN